MDRHPIEGLIKTAMESIKEMVDVNTIVGDAVETSDGSVIIPISRVCFGFAAGGSEFMVKKDNDKGNEQQTHPFGGGSGAGVSVQPVAFLIVGQNQVRLLPVMQSAMLERVIDVAPNILDQVMNVFKKSSESNTVQPI